MELYLLSTTKISEAKKQFGFYFPNLQLAFLQNTITGKQDEIKQDLVLLQLPWFREGVFVCDPKMSTGDFEEAVYQHHGLLVSVRVNFNGVWTNALPIGNLGLKAQNTLARTRTPKFHLNPARFFCSS